MVNEPADDARVAKRSGPAAGGPAEEFWSRLTLGVRCGMVGPPPLPRPGVWSWCCGAPVAPALHSDTAVIDFSNGLEEGALSAEQAAIFSGLFN